MGLFTKKPPPDTFKPLAIRRLADRSEGVRVNRYDPETGEKYLFNPESGLAEPWPFAGIKFEDGSPKLTRVPMLFVAKGVAEGWITGHQGTLVHRPGGPPHDLWRVTHTFQHYDALTFHTVDGDVLYDVRRQPDKYVTGDDDASVTPALYNAGETQVDWFYDLERNDG